VELFLNLLWCVFSLLLVVHWTRAASLRRNWKTGKAFVALLLLILLLLPVISVTDDLVTMTSPTEDEHIVRRGEMPLLHLVQDQAAMLDLGVLAEIFIGLAFLSSLLSRIIPRRSAVTLLDGFGMACGIRPPPSAAPLAA
jgi:competence protein ComGC